MRSFSMKFKTFWLIAVLALLIVISGHSQVKTVHNTLKEINACEGKIELILVREWGGGETDNEAQYFNMPYDIEIDSEDLIYIIDSGNSRIQVFDSSGIYQKTVGQAGNGPGDFSRPLDLAIDSQNNLIVSDLLNRRIQILDSEGEYIQGFKTEEGFASAIAVNKKNELMMYNAFKALKSLCYVFVYDYEGSIIREIVKLEQGKDVNAWTLESIFLSLDNHDNLYTAYRCTPHLEKYSKDGQLEKTITFEVPFEVPEIKMIASGADRKVRAEQVCFGIDVDDAGRIFVVTAIRPKTEKEKRMVSMVGKMAKDGTRHMGLVVKDYDKKITDLYRLFVFDSSGKIIAAKRLNHACNKITVHGDRLFVIDSYLEMSIYEYQIRF